MISWEHLFGRARACQHPTVGALEAFLCDHDVPPDAEVCLRPASQPETAGIGPSWDPRALVLVLAEAEAA